MKISVENEKNVKHQAKGSIFTVCARSLSIAQSLLLIIKGKLYVERQGWQ